MSPLLNSTRSEADGTYGDAPESVANCFTQDAPADPELAAVVEAWPALPEPIRAGILAMVRASVGQDSAK